MRDYRDSTVHYIIYAMVPHTPHLCICDITQSLTTFPTDNEDQCATTYQLDHILGYIQEGIVNSSLDGIDLLVWK